MRVGGGGGGEASVECVGRAPIEGGGRVCWGGSPLLLLLLLLLLLERCVVVVRWCAVTLGAGAGGEALEVGKAVVVVVGGRGRAPGWGGGGSGVDCVVVAGVEAGMVRVGMGLVSAEAEPEAVWGVMPVGLEAAVIGSFLWSWIGGIVGGGFVGR